MNIRNHHKKQKSNATLYHGRDAIDQHLATQLHIKLYSPQLQDPQERDIFVYKTIGLHYYVQQKEKLEE